MNKTVGWFASFMGTAMFVSYIDLIRLNLEGQTGSVILPAVTTVNCLAWTIYGFFRPVKDWPMVVPNAIGVVLGAIATLTSFSTVVAFLGF
ncbi:hypothetical protein LR002_03120 [Candidatus Gracilibacteria bacterium]|nr:hypothetical protein [Candidatus Gracilibacteria bacterium]